jgi:hypothetical protein
MYLTFFFIENNKKTKRKAQKFGKNNKNEQIFLHKRRMSWKQDFHILLFLFFLEREREYFFQVLNEISLHFY